MDAVKPYAVGEKVENWERYKLCPECGGKMVERCKCLAGDSECAQGHSWHLEYGRMCLGGWDHGRPVLMGEPPVGTR